MPEEQSNPPLPLDYAGAPPEPPRRFLLILLILCIGTATAISLMPLSHNHVYGTPPRAKCASNLHQIGLGILLYANENNGLYPDSLQTVALAEQLTPAVFVCPSSSDEPSAAPTTQGQMDDMLAPGHVSYIYIGKGLTNATVLPTQVIVYEPLSNHAGDGMNVLFGDGHAEWMNKTQAARTLADVKASTRPALMPPP